MLGLLLDNLPVFLLSMGLILIALEAFSPGAHLIVIGVAIAGSGFIGLLYPPANDILVLAVLTLLFGGVATYFYREFDFYGGKGTEQTSSSESLAGETGYVTETVTPRGGQVELDSGGFDPHYMAESRGETIEEGERIQVIDPGGGNVVTVAPAPIEESTGTAETDEETS